jgi:hypothetical protein
MKRLLLLFLLFGAWQQACGQSFEYARDYPTISKATGKSTTHFFYDSLKNRFTRSSSLLSNEELIALQIGYTQRPEYNPYGDIDLDRTFISAASWAETDTTVMYGTAYLQKNPVSLSATYALWKVYETRHNAALSGKYKVQFQALINAILSTGDGTVAHPYFVVGPIDGQILIRQYWQATIGVMGSGRDKQRNFLDMLDMTSADGKSKTVNFVIQHAVARM